MRTVSRREFGSMVVAGASLSASRGGRLVAASPLAIGVTTSSFRELARVTGRDNLDDIIAAVGAVRAADIELALANVEPAPPSVAPFMGGTPAYPRFVVLTPEEIAATNAHARAALREWRGRTGLDVFERHGAKLAAAGLTVHGCAVTYDDSFTDDEIDRTMRQVKALGARTISSPLTMAMAERLVPFADRHQVSLAIHNQVDGPAGGAIGARELRRALALSPAFRVKLDAGNITASNGDAVAELGELLPRTACVVITDRLRNGGRSQPFGEGDTPIRPVLQLLRSKAASVPVFVEYDYIGLRPVIDEVAASLRYLQAAG